MTKPNLAEQALTEAYEILCTLARIDNDKRWIKSSVPKGNLDRLSQKLRYKNIEHLIDTFYEPRVDNDYDGNGPFP